MIKFKHFAEVADSLMKPEDNKEVLSVEEFVKFNIYNKTTIEYCFAKYSPLNEEQKKELKEYLVNFKNGQIKGYDKNLEKWTKEVLNK